MDWTAYRKTVTVPSADPAAPGGEAEEAGGTFGIPVNYVEMGPPEGEQDRLAIVFVHGLSGCWQNWLEQIPHFARTHRVIALDLPGFGDSPPPPWPVTISRYGRLVLDFCSELDVRDAAVIGSSLGGFVAAETAIAEPGRFEKIALVSAVGMSSIHLPARRLAVTARLLDALAPLWLRLQTGGFRRPKARARSFEGVFRHPEQVRPELLWELLTGGARGQRFVEALTSIAGYDIHDRLREVDVPALVLWGRQDQIVPAADAPEYAGLLPNSRLEIFDECGHLPMAERPERFNRVLADFLRSDRETVI